jgi:hypothetical protein
MNQDLPPIILIKTWLDIQHLDIPQNVKVKRLNALTYYFGSIKLAMKYVERTDDYQQVS